MEGGSFGYCIADTISTVMSTVTTISANPLVLDCACLFRSRVQLLP